MICPTIPTDWTIAEELSGELPEVDDPDIALVQRYLAAETSEDYALIGMLARRIGVHHAGLSDETRALMEWLAEQGKLRILVATSAATRSPDPYTTLLDATLVGFEVE